MAIKQVGKSTDFYDRLKTKSKNSRFSRMLYRALVTSAPDNTKKMDETDMKMTEESEYFRKFSGDSINEIFIYRNNVFDETRSDAWVYKVGNSLHKLTLEKKIRKNLLFKSGDVVNPEIMATSEQLLRDLEYISDAYIVVVPNNKSNSGVNVYVFTRDKWTITAKVKSLVDDHYYFGLYDNNFLGTGNMLSLRTYVSLEDKMYGGNIVEYKILNIGGSFFDTELYAGKGYDERSYGAKIYKQLILPTDYMTGATLEGIRFYENQPLIDTVNLIGYHNLELWAGKSWYVKPLKASAFITGSYQDLEYNRAPEIFYDSNTYYHSRRTLLFSAGIYRESFYRGNMIYGFGATEDIPYGHKLELIAGRVWGEFNDKWYGALSLSAGKQSSVGYFRGEVMASTYMNSAGWLRQGMVASELDYFSNLLHMGRSGIRQFAQIRYMKGFGRDKGEGETLPFFEDDSPRGIRSDEKAGINRLIVNTETVFFSPLYFYGFRFAFYGFCDLGWLGNDSFVFKNDFYTTFGLGVRLKNERLIFNTIQLRFGLAVGKKGLVRDYNYFRYSNQSRLDTKSFKPLAPETSIFR